MEVRLIRLHIVNPNTTARMTQGIAQAAEAVSSDDVTIMATQADFGPPSIEDESLSLALSLSAMIGMVLD